ncbi:MAG TPA: hypothetical protein VM529_16980 [Gemmata sp.]|nr:hypothetical protein [Gemmata sp.]
MRTLFAAGLALAAAAAAGCGGGPKIAEVSGVVTLNGKPYPNAVVSFQPVGSNANPNPGRGSVAETDENGRFKLVYDGGESGAIVGKHRVRIFTKLGAEIPDTEGDPEAAAAAAKAAAKSGKGGKAKRQTMGNSSVEPIPPEWNENSTKEFDVPPQGTTEANFAIENPKVKN